MPVFRLGRDLLFPPPELAEEDGLLGVGGDLSPERLLLGYRSGIFPWFDAEQPPLWWSPAPRFVITPESFHVGRTIRKQLRSFRGTLTRNREFLRVMEECRDAPRAGHVGSWIHEQMLSGYGQLHEAGYAHSVEVWDEVGRLKGGLYGVSIGSIFFGESMFSSGQGESKIAFAWFASELFRRGWTLIDCQLETEHLKRFGGHGVSREVFQEHLSLAGIRVQSRGERLRERWEEEDG